MANRDSVFGISPQAKNLQNPSARLFVKRNSIGPKVISTIVHIKNLLQLKGIFEDEIEEILISEDEQRYKDIVEKTGGKEEFPIVFIQDVYIGNVDSLEDWVVSEKLDALLEKVYNVQRPRSNSQIERQAVAIEQHICDIKQQKELLEDEMAKARQQDNHAAVEELQNSIFLLDRDINSMTKIMAKTVEKRHNSKSESVDHSATTSSPIQIPTQPINIRTSSSASSSSPSSSPMSSFEAHSPGIVDKAYETGKWWVKGMGSAITGVTSYLSWGATESVISTSPPKEYKDAKGSNYVEFEVMQINWYWRQQKRILRISKDRLLRINPYTKEMRAMHYYRSIKEIVVNGKTFMTISFNDNLPPEYYQSASLDKIITAITERAQPTVIPVTYVKEQF